LVPYLIHRKNREKGTKNLYGGVLLKLLRSRHGASIEFGWIIRRARVGELKLAVNAELIAADSLEAGLQESK
jgi:hypothetical protein